MYWVSWAYWLTETQIGAGCGAVTAATHHRRQPVARRWRIQQVSSCYTAGFLFEELLQMACNGSYGQNQGRSGVAGCQRLWPKTTLARRKSRYVHWGLRLQAASGCTKRRSSRDPSRPDCRRESAPSRAITHSPGETECRQRRGDEQPENTARINLAPVEQQPRR